MGEIADALRRAKLGRKERQKEERDWLDDDADHGEGALDPFSLESPRSADGAESVDAKPWSTPGKAPRTPVPREREDFWVARSVLMPDQGPIAEAFRHFALRLRQELVRRKNVSVLLTSPLRSEGKTVTACNLALALASISAGRRLALVDLDLRKPSVGMGIGIAAGAGLQEVLAGTAKLRDACVPTEIPGLDVFPATRPAAAAHELLAGPRMAAVVRELVRRYDVVVIDTPPVLLVPDVPLLLAHVDACVVVARAGQTQRKPFRDALKAIPSEKIVGVFLNYARCPQHLRSYRKHGYHGTSSSPEESVGDGT